MVFICILGVSKSDQEYEEDMKDELDNVMGLLDRMKEERQEEMLSSQSERVSRLERLKRSRKPHGQVNGHKDTTYPPEGESPSYEDLGREGQQKRKQDFVVAELREKAEIISKSARKGPEEVASSLSRNQNVEDDPETAQYLKNIRDTSTSDEASEKRQQFEKNTVVVELPSQAPKHKTSVTVKLNLDMQKSKIAVARGSGLQGRRKPTSEHIRRSLHLSDQEEPEDVLAKFDADLEEGMEADDEDEPPTPNEVKCVEADFSESMGTAEAKVMPQSPLEYGERMVLERRGSFDGLIPRSSPKPRKPSWKSKTYGGVRLPAFAEAMRAGSKSLKKTDTAEKLLTADVVKQAALDKLNRAAKEDLPEKEPEKPAWLVEAEARRKLHDRRRNTGEREKIKPSEADDKVIPIRLKKTGSKLLEEDIDKVSKLQEDMEDDSQTNKFVFKLKPTMDNGGKQSFEPEPTKISFKLKPTGIQLVESEPSKQDFEPNEEPLKATFVNDFETEPPVSSIRLRHVSSKPEPVVHRLEGEDNMVTSSVQLRHISPRPKPEHPSEEQERPSPSVRQRHIAPEPEPGPETRVKDQERPAASVRLRHITPKPIVTDFEAEPELAMKLRQRGKAPPIHPDEEDTKVQISRVIPYSKQSQTRVEPQVSRGIPTWKPTQPQDEPQISRVIPSMKSHQPQDEPQISRVIPSMNSQPQDEPQISRVIPSWQPSQHREEPHPSRVIPSSRPSQLRDESPVRKSQTPKTYAVPKPIKVVPTNEYREPRAAVTLERKPLETAKVINQEPMHTTTDRTPVSPQMRPYTPKQFYKITPLESEPTRRLSYGSSPQVYDIPSTTLFSQPLSPTSSRTFSPPMSPTSNATVASHGAEPVRPPKERSLLPAKLNRGRRISAERSKTVAVSGNEVQRIIPGRTVSSSDEPQRHPFRRTSSFEYPKSHFERAGNGHLKHAVTVVKASSLAQKARTLAVDSPRQTASEVIIPFRKHDFDRRRKISSSKSEQDFFVRSWTSLSNQENEPQIVTQLEPRWMRELPDRRLSGFDSTPASSDIQPDRMEAIERLETKSTKTLDSEDEVREVPSFIKEFERKRRLRTRGFQLLQRGLSSHDQSYA